MWRLLQAMAKTSHTPFVHHPHGGLALFGNVAADFFAAMRNLESVLQDRLMRMLLAQFAAETSLAHAGRNAAPRLNEWRAMRRKSAGPMAIVAMALMGPGTDAHVRGRLTRLEAVTGHLLWIVDDLVDAPEDWRQAVWSRPWWVVSRRGMVNATMGIDHALWALDRVGWADMEAARIAKGLRRLDAISDGHGAELRRRVALTISAWAA